MSDEAEQDSKTEKPTERRISDAIEKGNVPFSKEVVIFVSLFASLIALNLSSSFAVGKLNILLGGVVEQASALTIDNGNDYSGMLKHVFSQSFIAILPFLLIVAIGGILGSLLQNVPNASTERLRPKAERVSIAQNAKRMFGAEARLEFAKSLAKLATILIVIYTVFKKNLTHVLGATGQDPSHLPKRIFDTSASILTQVCLVAFLIAIADAVYTRIKWHNSLKMSRQELKDEFKQLEGNMQLKQRIKELGRQRVKKQMMSDLPRATLVVVNPTHYAVALRYVPAEGGAPVVIAKGLDHLAIRIRGLCEEKQIPVIENKTLARSLHGACEVGSTIPVEFYHTLAEIIHFVEMRKRLILKRS